MRPVSVAVFRELGEDPLEVCLVQDQQPVEAFPTWVPLSRARRSGLPAVDGDLRALIRQMRAANPLWGGRESLAS